MKETPSLNIDRFACVFTRITFPGQAPWYQVHLTGESQSITFWMKRDGQGEWKIQPQLLPQGINQQEQAFGKVIGEQEFKTLYYT